MTAADPGKSDTAKKAGTKSGDNAAAGAMCNAGPGVNGRRNFLSATALVATAAVMNAQEKKVDGGLAVITDKKIPERKTAIVPPGASGLKDFYQQARLNDWWLGLNVFLLVFGYVMSYLRMRRISLIVSWKDRTSLALLAVAVAGLFLCCWIPFDTAARLTAQ